MEYTTALWITVWSYFNTSLKCLMSILLLSTFPSYFLGLPGLPVGSPWFRYRKFASSLSLLIKCISAFNTWSTNVYFANHVSATMYEERVSSCPFRLAIMSAYQSASDCSLSGNVWTASRWNAVWLSISIAAKPPISSPHLAWLAQQDQKCPTPGVFLPDLLI